jgi:hypothetical protein
LFHLCSFVSGKSGQEVNLKKQHKEFTLNPCIEANYTYWTRENIKLLSNILILIFNSGIITLRTTMRRIMEQSLELVISLASR